MSEKRVWSIEIVFAEDDDHTVADARLQAGGRDLAGWGRARRNPLDPSVPVIGEDLAAARALSDLAHRLLHEAAETIEKFEGGPVVVHG
jgi:hypothetical protein